MPDNQKRCYTQRPASWREIVKYKLDVAKLRKVLIFYGDQIPGKDENSKGSTLFRWCKDYQQEIASNVSNDYNGSPSVPCYGSAIDNNLASKIDRRLQDGIITRNFELQRLLLDLLRENNRDDILEAFKKDVYTFGNSWALRFWKRHKFTSRIANTKMRNIIPENLDVMVEKYTNIYSYFIHKFKIRDEMITGFDETNMQFVPTITRTRARQGARRVRVQGTNLL